MEDLGHRHCLDTRDVAARDQRLIDELPGPLRIVERDVEEIGCRAPAVIQDRLHGVPQECAGAVGLEQRNDVAVAEGDAEQSRGEAVEWFQPIRASLMIVDPERSRARWIDVVVQMAFGAVLERRDAGHGSPDGWSAAAL
ncbi:hypothetical protein KCH_03650 [Kitasatospora cheerisanensis KCTC 2395]|uniref:Uncharacterized protein n=1 Tax=Kitasatospora cheerisanensis KCTC 2395 TaxID=1348663 RepID=A0A066Z1T7_9ACTN|nr:hypothetical protein KCH_03650 [Kitasatospora cheerisanensis KCTC 2395]